VCTDRDVEIATALASGGLLCVSFCGLLCFKNDWLRF